MPGRAPQGSAPVILLVEDNEHDVVLTEKALQRTGLPVAFYHVENGVECMAFLRKEGPHAGVPTPDLVLLDLNMPVMDGREVLAEILADDRLRALPVVVLTTSADDRDVLEMYRYRCSSYITKPVDFDQFVEVVRQIYEYWFKVVVLPRTPR